MSKRAERRHHLTRMKAKARRVASHSWGMNTMLYRGEQEQLEQDLKNVEHRADYLKSCSCPMCCNPRHNGWSDSITKQEYLNYLKYLEENGMEDRAKHGHYPSR